MRNAGFFALLCVLCVLVGCTTKPSQMLHTSDLQRQAIEERLEGWELGELQQACDDCDFYMQEAVASKSANTYKGRAGGVRSETGVRVYRFDNVSIERALYMLLDSTIFARNMNKEMKSALMQAILDNKNDFMAEDGEDRIGLYSFSSISFAKRLKNDATLPRAMLDSVAIMQGQGESLHSTNSLEGFIVGKQIVILHFYGESNTWSRR